MLFQNTTDTLEDLLASTTPHLLSPVSYAYTIYGITDSPWYSNTTNTHVLVSQLDATLIQLNEQDWINDHPNRPLPTHLYLPGYEALSQIYSTNPPQQPTLNSSRALGPRVLGTPLPQNLPLPPIQHTRSSTPTRRNLTQRTLPTQMAPTTRNWTTNITSTPSTNHQSTPNLRTPSIRTTTTRNTLHNQQQTTFTPRTSFTNPTTTYTISPNTITHPHHTPLTNSLTPHSYSETLQQSLTSTPTNTSNSNNDTQYARLESTLLNLAQQSARESTALATTLSGMASMLASLSNRLDHLENHPTHHLPYQPQYIISPPPSQYHHHPYGPTSQQHYSTPLHSAPEATQQASHPPNNNQSNHDSKTQN